MLVLFGALVLDRKPPRIAEPTAASTPENPSSEASLPISQQRDWDIIDNVWSEGWDTEAFSNRAEEQLERLCQWVLSGPPLDSNRVASLTADSFASSELLPAERTTVFESELLTVSRYAPPPDPGDAGPDRADAHRGPAGLAAALRRLSEPFTGARNARHKVKVFDVRELDDGVLTRQHISLSGRTDSGMLEQNATWTAMWEDMGPVQSPRLQRLVVERFEQVKSSAPPFFSDCTASVLEANDSYRDQLLHGVDYWLARTQNFVPFAAQGRYGIAVGDVNGDGLDDLYVCQDKGLPNRLYVQQPDATLLDVSASSGVDWLESSHSALLLDLDGDADQDLAVAILGAVVVAENDGGGRFTQRGIITTSDDTMSLCAADFDLDADLDLYVCVYGPDILSRKESQDMIMGMDVDSFVYYDANIAGPGALLRNEGDWRFTDCTREAGLDVNNRRFSFAAAWEDVDQDGDPDLYVANDFGRNNLYRNDGGRFTDIAAQADVEDSASGMSVSWGDFDRDGHPDLYVGNMFSAAGSRIVAQTKFMPELSDPIRDVFLRFARGNTLMQNRGDGTFADVSLDTGVTLGRWAWSSNFLDLNNDGWEDLVVANGYLSSDLDQTGDL